jgi:hypothetical protein
VRDTYGAPVGITAARTISSARRIPSSPARLRSTISLSDFAVGFDIYVKMLETDIQLLTRYADQRAEDAFAEIVRCHVVLVPSGALRQVRSPELAEEVTQTVFIELAS